MRFMRAGPVAACIVWLAVAVCAAPAPRRSDRTPEPPVAVLAGPGERCPLPGGYHLTYGFASHPQLGTVVLKVRVFDGEGRQVAPFSLQGRYDMPEMKGAHDSGEQEFKLNRKGDYLLPVSIVMPGAWQLTITVRKGKKATYRGALHFKV